MAFGPDPAAVNSTDVLGIDIEVFPFVRPWSTAEKFQVLLFWEREKKVLSLSIFSTLRRNFGTSYHAAPLQ